MSTSKIVAVIAVAALGLFTAVAQAESIPQEEADQFGNSARPDVDAGASRGADESIVKQEQNQFGNEPADLESNRQAGGGPSITTQEKEGLSE